MWDTLALSGESGAKPSYFRLLTLLSFHVFMSEGVDAAVYEAGVGGEYDSTNVFRNPAATGVTSLGIDHVLTLGSTLEEIAWHKAGIFRQGVPAFTVAQEQRAAKVLEDRAEDRGTKLVKVAVHPGLDQVALKPAEEFQRRNASLAIQLSAAVMGKLGVRVRVDTRPETLPLEVAEGLKNGAMRGRGEILKTGAQRWYLDGAHNEQSLPVACSWFSRVSKVK